MLTLLLLLALLHPWEPFEVTLTQPAPITFTSNNQRYTVPAFPDGPNTWKARFAPPTPGDWQYATPTTKGNLQVTPWTEVDKQSNPTRRGFLYVSKNGRHFQHADGTPFLWIADTWWNWTKKDIHFETFQKLVDDRAAKGYTLGQIFFPPTDDLDHIRHVERLVSYANSKGITIWLHAVWANDTLRKTTTPDAIRNWWRTVIHRFHAYNVIWVLAGEYNMHNYAGFPLDFWKDLGRMIKAEDPYKRIVSTHPTPPLWGGGAGAPQWSTAEVLHKEPWLDYNQSQVGHGKPRQEMIPLIVADAHARKPAKPIVVTEPWYEFIAGMPTAEDIRFGAWSAILSGAAGHTHGGGHQWWAHVPESPAKVAPWPIDPSFEPGTLDYPGAVSIGFLARFLKGLEWWRLEPHPELVHDYPARYCAAIPGREYLVYVRWAGGLRLDLSKARGQFRYEWIDLTNPDTRRKGTLQGGAIREVPSPEGYPPNTRFTDWLLHVQLDQ